MQRDKADEPHNEDSGKSCGVKEVMICEQQYDFMPRKKAPQTTMFSLRVLMETYSEELHCVFII